MLSTGNIMDIQINASCNLWYQKQTTRYLLIYPAKEIQVLPEIEAKKYYDSGTNKLKNLKSLVLNGVEAGLQKKRNTHQKSMAQINDERSGVCCLIFIVNVYNHNIIVLFWSDFFINIIGLNASKRGRRKCIFLDQTGLNLALKLKCHTSIKHRDQDGNQSRVQ